MDATTRLPRFNMPLELGLFLGCKRYGPPQQSQKRSIILDRELHRYRQFISDIAGQDIHAHGGSPDRAIIEIRDWLQATSKRKLLPGGSEIIQQYRRFQSDLPSICSEARLDPSHLTFIDLSWVVTQWLRSSR